MCLFLCLFIVYALKYVVKFHIYFILQYIPMVENNLQYNHILLYHLPLKRVEWTLHSVQIHLITFSSLFLRLKFGMY